MDKAELFYSLFSGGDRRQLKRSGEAIALVRCQADFNVVFQLLLSGERLIVMRAADAAEKITRKHPGYLLPHKRELLRLMRKELYHELQWHIAAMLPRLALTEREFLAVFSRLKAWTLDNGAGTIARVWSLQGMYELAFKNPGMQEEFWNVAAILQKTDVPALRARIRIIRKAHRQY